MEIYNATSYTDAPAGLSSQFTIIYEDDLFSTQDREEVDYAKIAEVAQAHQNDSLVCLDIECWELNDGDIYRLHDSITKYREACRAWKKVAPNPKLGLFARPPNTDSILANASEHSSDYNRWRELCERMEPLGDYVDVIFPTFYARYENLTFQERIINQYMYASHRYGVKRVIPFFCPRYVSVIDNPSLNDQLLSGEYTQRIMDVVAKHTDEMVLWDYAANQTFQPGQWWPVLESYL